jgi:hypothetical protein
VVPAAAASAHVTVNPREATQGSYAKLAFRVPNERDNASTTQLEVKVVEAGSRHEVENRTGQELLVLGYKGEPYLRIGPDGVFENKLSPATYLNKSRKGGTPPESAEKAKVGDTDWAKVSSAPVARWHDHRIHWMGNINPPDVRNRPGERHVIKMSADDSQWSVPMKLAGAQDVVVKGDLVWVPGPSPLPWYLLIVVVLALVIAVGRSAAWARGLAALTAVLLAVDVFHVIGLGLANAGSLSYRLSKAFTQSPFEIFAWLVGGLAIVWLPRRGSDGLPLVALAGLQIALVGGVGDLAALSNSVAPFGFGTGLARLAVALSIGLGFGLAAAAGLRLAGVFGPVRTEPKTPVPGEPVAAPTTS